MKLSLGDKRSDGINIDFDAPVKMSDKQKNDFLNFFKSIFEPSVIDERHLKDINRDRLGNPYRKSWPRTWTAEEYAVLLQIDSKDNAQVAKELGRTEMCILRQRVKFMHPFEEYVHKKNVSLVSTTPEEVKKLIADFMNEEEMIKKMKHEERLKRKKELKAKVDSKAKELDSTKNELHNIESKIKTCDWDINAGRPKNPAYNTYCLERDHVKTKIKELEQELELLRQNRE